MQVGVNWLSPYTFPIINNLLQSKIADFCEIMVDNFIHLSPASIKNLLPDVPIALHIVASRFLEKDLNELTVLANRLRPWIRELNPIYVSDHLAQFTMKGRRLPFVSELNYQNSVFIKHRINEWQSLLEVPILFENHASLTSLGVQQAEFFSQLLHETPAGLLFDFSNAYIADHNGVCALSAWDDLVSKTNFFHVAGFKIDDTTQLALDTHDREIADPVIVYMQKTIGHLKNKTLVVEFDNHVNVELWKNEILKIKRLMSKNWGQIPNFSRGEEDFFLTSIDMKSWRHRIFSFAPQLLALSEKENREILQPFLAFADAMNLPMDFLLHLQLLEWLYQQEKWRAHLSTDIIKELMIATVMRWALTGLDHVNVNSILVATPYLPSLAIQLQKSSEPTKANKILLMQLPLHQHPQQTSYALSKENDWNEIKWMSLAPVVLSVNK